LAALKDNVKPVQFKGTKKKQRMDPGLDRDGKPRDPKRRYSVGGTALPSYHEVMKETHAIHEEEHGPAGGAGGGCCTIG
jgi:hypothetical protein